MPDDRSKADKLRDVINGRGTTAGERENAQRLLDAHLAKNPEPVRTAPRHSDGFDPFADFMRRWGKSTSTNSGFNAGRDFNDFWRTYWPGETPVERELREAKEDLDRRTAGMTPNQRREYVRKRMAALAEELDRQTAQSYTSRQQELHDRFGIHTYTVIGQNTVGRDIERCIICGEYAAKTTGTDKQSTCSHDDWDLYNPSYDNLTGDTMLSRKCRACKVMQRARVVSEGEPIIWRKA
jgi:NAD-dependent SIR2 family protein deacetylase